MAAGGHQLPSPRVVRWAFVAAATAGAQSAGHVQDGLHKAYAYAYAMYLIADCYAM